MVFCNIEISLLVILTGLILINCHNPYFNRWFSAIKYRVCFTRRYFSHNPYFNRWFSAIFSNKKEKKAYKRVTILILIDGFLQYYKKLPYNYFNGVTILILIDGFLQFVHERVQAKFMVSHNPYFNRWFSAINCLTLDDVNCSESQSLF